MWIKRHIVLFTVTIFKIWLYKENLWITRHIVLFIIINYQIWIVMENMCLVIDIDPFL